MAGGGLNVGGAVNRIQTLSEVEKVAFETESDLFIQPIDLLIQSGAGQEGIVNTLLPVPPVVQVVDSTGMPLPGVDVRFWLELGGGNIQDSRSATDSMGRASPGFWRLSTLAGLNKMYVVAGDSQYWSDTLIIEALGIPGQAVRIRFIDTSQNEIAGVPFLRNIMVEALDSFGNRDTSFRDTCRLQLDPPAAVSHWQAHQNEVVSQNGQALWHGIIVHREFDSLRWKVTATGMNPVFGNYFRVNARLPTGLSYGYDTLTAFYGDTVGGFFPNLLDDGGGRIVFGFVTTDTTGWFGVDSLTGTLTWQPVCPKGDFVRVVSATNSAGSCYDTVVIRIMAAPLIVRVLAHNKIYGDTLGIIVEPGSRCRVFGLKNLDWVQWVQLNYGNNAHNNNAFAGKYPCTPISVFFNSGAYSNYEIQFLGDSLEVQKAPLQIGVLRHSKVYGDSLTEIALPGDPRVVYRDWETDRKSTRLNSSHSAKSRMPSSA